jgi:hypothetical protein
MKKPAIVCFDVQDPGWSVDYECISAEQVDNWHYTLLGIPRFGYRLSSHDVVSVRKEGKKLIAER